MKYVLLFCGTREQQQAWEEMSEEARQAQYAQVGRWFAENAARLGPGNQLQSPHTATTVRFQGGGSIATADVPAALAAVFREEAGGLTAALVRILGDFDVAEEIVQDALLIALERWPIDGITERPGAWLLTVARRRAL